MRQSFLWSLTIALSVISQWGRAEETVSPPLTKVVLFDVGLGYFEHQLQVNGTVKAELPFDEVDLKDLLKSLVLQDLGGERLAR